MKTDFLKNVLSENAFGFAFLDAESTITTHNPAFQRYIQSSHPLNDHPLFRHFPETVGLEGVLSEIAAGRRRFFMLENINREEPDGKTGYFNISFYPTGDADQPIFCLLEDVTQTALLYQHVRQKENAILLLERTLAAEGRTVALLGNSPGIDRVRQLIKKIARIPVTTVLLHGESGTGKSMIARILHNSTGAKNAPFIEINCAAIPEALLESELFGYEKGAFTNAISSKPGLLEASHGGTLFLDEISEMPPNLQAKLLSFLETRRFRRLGSVKEIEVQSRVITATNRDLNEWVEAGKFREDLYYRLNVVQLPLPPLRELGEDVLTIAQHFIQMFNGTFHKSVHELTPAASQKLLHYSWPGNVRELRNALERAMIFAEADLLDHDDLQLGSTKAAAAAALPLDHFSLPPEGLSFESVEKKLLESALEISNGNQSKAAKMLQLSRDAFRYRLEKHGLL